MTITKSNLCQIFKHYKKYTQNNKDTEQKKMAWALNSFFLRSSVLFILITGNSDSAHIFSIFARHTFQYILDLAWDEMDY